MREVAGMLGGGDDGHSMGHDQSSQLGHMQISFVASKPWRLLIDLAIAPKLLAVSGCVATSFLFPPLSLR